MRLRATLRQRQAIWRRCDELGVVGGTRRLDWLRELTDTDPRRLSRAQATNLLTLLYMEYQPDEAKP